MQKESMRKTPVVREPAAVGGGRDGRGIQIRQLNRNRLFATKVVYIQDPDSAAKNRKSNGIGLTSLTVSLPDGSTNQGTDDTTMGQ